MSPIVLLSPATLEISLTLVKTNLQKINKNYESALTAPALFSISRWLSITYVIAHNIFAFQLKMEMRPDLRRIESQVQIERSKIAISCAHFIKAHFINNLLDRIHLVRHQRHAPFPIIQSC